MLSRTDIPWFGKTSGIKFCVLLTSNMPKTFMKELAASGCIPQKEERANAGFSGRRAPISQSPGARMTSARCASEKGSFMHSAAPKSKTEFNGAGGLLTYISFTPAVLG